MTLRCAWPLALLMLTPIVLVRQAPGQAAHSGEIHLALGNPSAAKHDLADANNYLMVKDQYALSYNDKKGTPNWVSYHLGRQDMGRAPRAPFFAPDETLPRSFHQVKPGDYFYNLTGMTRGHMCPNSHRNNTEANSTATFIMTNMVPQTEELNGGSWEGLERHCRDLCFEHGKELFVVCGPHGMGGVSSKGRIDTVGHEHVVVPKNCWKVMLVMNAGSFHLGKLPEKGSMHAIAVLMPNSREPTEDVPWSKYTTSIAEIESLTGYRFFDRLPDEIREPLRKQIDTTRGKTFKREGRP